MADLAAMKPQPFQFSLLAIFGLILPVSIGSAMVGYVWRSDPAAGRIALAILIVYALLWLFVHPAALLGQAIADTWGWLTRKL